MGKRRNWMWKRHSADGSISMWPLFSDDFACLCLLSCCLAFVSRAKLHFIVVLVGCLVPHTDWLCIVFQ